MRNWINKKYKILFVSANTREEVETIAINKLPNHWWGLEYVTLKTRREMSCLKKVNGMWKEKEDEK